MPDDATVRRLLARFDGATTELLARVLTPYHLPITQLNISERGAGSTFRASVPAAVWATFEQGTTGKIVPRGHVEDHAPWMEIMKGRILGTDGLEVWGELHFPGSGRLEHARRLIRIGDYLEVDPFGVSSKIESALCEGAFFQGARKAGFAVARMPENVAMHIGTQNYYDFRLERHGRVYRVELKSLWGTDTTKARLIHSVSKGGEGGKNSTRADRQVWRTSSCRFHDQDVFAVSMWLRTGRITDFAYCLSVPEAESPRWGLPFVPMYPEHVTQNPPIKNPPADPWTSDLNTICQRFDDFRDSGLPR